MTTKSNPKVSISKISNNTISIIDDSECNGKSGKYIKGLDITDDGKGCIYAYFYYRNEIHDCNYDTKKKRLDIVYPDISNKAALRELYRMINMK